MTDSRPHVALLGLRGIPAAHSGYEAFAQRLALHLVAGGWRVSFYCQEVSDGRGDELEEAIVEDEWQGVRRVMVPSGPAGRRASVRFDWRAIGHVIDHPPDVVLTFGYHTGLFDAKLRVAGVPQVINMGGLEWRRRLWSWPVRAMLYLNERIACLAGQRLIADHPAIARHLSTRVRADKVSTIPYAADELDREMVPDAPLQRLGLTSGRYVTLMARPEPDQSTLEIVRAFSADPRGLELAVVGRFLPEASAYHRAVMAAASPEVRFLGVVEDASTLAALRAHTVLHVHGHQIGGTDPGLVQALGAGNPVLAHQNRFNYWVCGAAAEYFHDERSCAAAFDELLSDPFRLREMSYGSRQRHRLEFRWERVLQRYEQLLFRMIRRPTVVAPSRYAEVTSGLRLRDFEAQGASASPLAPTAPGPFYE
jgi:glycosyltransferase involved in cell wall biosynthesis